MTNDYPIFGLGDAAIGSVEVEVDAEKGRWLFPHFESARMRPKVPDFLQAKVAASPP